MKKFTFSFKSLLVAAGLLIGSANAWGYDVPTGYEISQVFVGTLNGDGTVSAETFDGTPDISGWSTTTGNCSTTGHTPALAVREVTNVACPEVGSTTSNGDDPVTYFYPTYVDGKVLNPKSVVRPN